VNTHEPYLVKVGQRNAPTDSEEVYFQGLLKKVVILRRWDRALLIILSHAIPIRGRIHVNKGNRVTSGNSPHSFTQKEDLNESKNSSQHFLPLDPITTMIERLNEISVLLSELLRCGKVGHDPI